MSHTMTPRAAAKAQERNPNFSPQAEHRWLRSLEKSPEHRATAQG